MALVSVADVQTTLSLGPATVRAARPTDDHLPPDDDPGMTLHRAVRVSQELRAAVRRGSYRPAPAHFVAVPKRSGGSRPAAVLTEADRVIYEALVRTVAPVIDAALAGPSVLYGPRGRNRSVRWLSFERAVLRPRPSYVVMADVADFYTGINHDVLWTSLGRAGADPRRLGALGDLLAVLMAGGCGLPQGVAASMALATSYFSSIDDDMVRRGWAYTRCQDDVRIGVNDEAAGQRAIMDLTEAAAGVGLSLRGGKTRVLTRDEYLIRLPVGAAWERWMWRLAPAVEGRLLHRTVGTAMDQALRWLRGRGATTPARDAMDLALRQPPLGADEEEDLCRFVETALCVLGAAGAPDVTELAPAVLRRFPSETPLVVRSLAVLLRGPERDAAQAVLEGELVGTGLTWPSQQAWIYWALRPVAATVDPSVVSKAAVAVSSPIEWMSRTQAALLLAARGDLDVATRYSLLESVPAPIRPWLRGIARPASVDTPSERRRARPLRR